MLKLEYSIEINATKKKVWTTMLKAESYKEWTSVSWPGSYYEGKWAKGENIKFLLPGRGGTMANLIECKPHDSILAEHIALINADGKEDRNRETSQGWIGTTERYDFEERNGKTELKVIVETTPEWRNMFDNGWPGALESLKKICER